MKDVKVVFLDVDGVLNSPRNVVAFGGYPWPNCKDETSARFEGNLDKLAVGMLKRLCDETGAVVVLHSTWRKHMSPEAFTELTGLPCVSRTDPAYEPKCDAIAAWFRDNWNTYNVTHYCVVEDEDVFNEFYGGLTAKERAEGDMYTNAEMESHLVLTDVYNGFTFDNLLKCAKLLGVVALTPEQKMADSSTPMLHWAMGFDESVQRHHA